MITVLIASFISFVITFLGTPIAIRILVGKGYGQLIRDDGPTSHHTKRGTPTMGGAVIIIAVVAGYLLAHLLRWSATTPSGLIVLFLMCGLGTVGFLDDYIKVSKQRSLGLRTKAKLIGQAAVAVAFAILALQFEDSRGETPADLAISFIRETPIELPPVLFIIWALLIVAAASNAVNLTDGLDGLATGACVMVFAAYTLITVWQFNQRCSVIAGPNCYDTP